MGGYPPEIVDSKGKCCLDGIQMEVDGDGNATGKLRDTKRAVLPGPGLGENGRSAGANTRTSSRDTELMQDRKIERGKTCSAPSS